MVMAMGSPMPHAQAATCTPTGFFRDGINMTAALINPAGVVTGEVNAAGCNIGVYADNGSRAVVNANIHGANYFGILVNGDVNNVKFDVKDSQVHDIGETPFNGSQHGVAIYYRAFGTGTTAGTISGTTVSLYQKGGIVVNGAGSNVNVKQNNAIGFGAVSFIAQNGIQVGFGATGTVTSNTATGHSYSGPNFASSGGILIVGGACYGSPLTVGTQVVGNTLVGNDVGVFVSNLDGTCSAPSSQTNIKIVNNDKLITNKISGAGYKTCATGYCVAIDADASFTNKAKVHANVIE